MRASGYTDLSQESVLGFTAGKPGGQVYLSRIGLRVLSIVTLVALVIYVKLRAKSLLAKEVDAATTLREEADTTSTKNIGTTLSNKTKTLDNDIELGGNCENDTAVV